MIKRSAIHRPVLMLLLPALLLVAGCDIFGLVGGISSNYERTKKIEVLAEYDGLVDKSCAVVVHADLSVLYEHPTAVPNIAANVSRRIQSNVNGVSVLSPREVLDWQYHTPSWSMMPYGQIAEDLGVDRVVYIDIYEYRLNPPGNRWLWEGVCAANVGVVERGGFDPDQFVETYNVICRFPDLRGLGRESATQAQIQTGLQARFVEESAWLFYTHIEDKYPEYQ
ncbi:MAG: hypothetical protein CMJ32_04080 [Phycisphaerae bacterium]|nr:hypothetical protein [Phycisphaerae bacterium]